VYQAHYLAAGKTLNLHMLVTPLGNLVAAGAAPRLAWSLQAMASVLSAAAVFLAFRQGTQPVAALFTAMFLCAPHAYAYDTLPLIAAMLMLAPASVAGVTGCALVYLAPDLLLSGHGGWLIYTVPEALLLISFIYLAIGRTPRPNASYEPVSSTRSRPGQC
jgi:hypothetical protein